MDTGKHESGILPRRRLILEQIVAWPATGHDRVKDNSKMPANVFDFEGVGALIPDGEYHVVLTKTTMKQSSKGDDMILFDATIQDDDAPEENGKHVFRNCVLTQKTLIFVKQTMLAFGADPELFSGKVDVTAECEALYGNGAIAVVTTQQDSRDPTGNTKQNSVSFKQDL